MTADLLYSETERDLAAAIRPGRGSDSKRARGVPSPVAIRSVEARDAQGLTRVSDPRLGAIPAGPMPWQAQFGRAGEPTAKSTDVVLAAGYCGLSAGLLAIENRRGIGTRAV